MEESPTHLVPFVQPRVGTASEQCFAGSKIGVVQEGGVSGRGGNTEASLRSVRSRLSG